MQEQSPQLAFELADGLRGKVALGLLEAEGVASGPLPEGFVAERDQLCGRIAAQHAGRAPADIPGVAETRVLFHALGVDPTKTRPSSEALLRRVMQGKGLPQVGRVVDVCNLCSLEHQLPLGLYDRGHVKGVVRARLGLAGEGYTGIRKDRVNLFGRLLLADDDGAFGAPTNDSLRTCVTDATTRVLVVVFCPIERADRDLSSMLESVARRLESHASGRTVAVRVTR